MAEEKKRKRVRQVKTVSDETTKKTEKKSRVRKKPTLRERNVEASKKQGKQSRTRKVGSGLKTGGRRIGGALTREYHVIAQNEEDPGFFMKSRTFTPRYFVNSWHEIRQVEWPGFKTTWKLVFAVFIFAFIIGGFIAGLDALLEKAFREVVL